MKKAIQFYDVLGNVIQIKTVIDTFRQIQNKPCWIVESRKVFPQSTNWECLLSLENQYYNTKEDAQEAIKKRLLDYAENAKKMKKDSWFEEVVL